jgi:hypothetical protein
MKIHVINLSLELLNGTMKNPKITQFRSSNIETILQLLSAVTYYQWIHFLSFLIFNKWNMFDQYEFVEFRRDKSLQQLIRAS